MRKFKNAAVASATALALTLAGTTAASAATNDTQAVELSTTSSEWGVLLNGDQAATGEQGFGMELDSEAPAWIKAWNVGLWTLAGGVIAGTIIAGFNWLKHEGIII